MNGINRLAFVFPGQGSQSVGMLAALAAGYPLVTGTFGEASNALDLDLWRIVQDGPEEMLNRTDVTQPALLAAGVAVWRVWEAEGGAAPGLLAGHSLGEYTALTCAGALDFADAVRLVRDRGRFMQEAVPPGAGAMAAVLGLDDETVIDVCHRAAEGGVVEAVNFNAPGQVVIAGAVAAVDRALGLAAAAGAKRAIKLPVSVPSHCALMHPAADRLRERLSGVNIQLPRIPVLHNVDAQAAETPEAVRDRLVRQIHSPVLWVETVRAMAGAGIERLVECGPGKVLAGLNRRIDRGLAIQPVYDPETLSKALQSD